VNWWSLWTVGFLAIGARAIKDWRDPNENRTVTLALIGTFGLILAVAALIIIVFG
jgi:hypothetical protein